MKKIKEKFKKTLDYIHRNILIILLINAILAIISPWLFTRRLDLLDFTNTGQIGDTIGGITSPFINFLNAILIYITFTEQKKSNTLLESQINESKNVETQKLENIKKIILWDLENSIKVDAKKIITETENYLKVIHDEEIKMLTDYVDFNDKIFSSNSLNDYFLIFNKENNDLKKIINIYNRVEFIYERTPYKISHKYPVDKTNDKFLSINDKEEVNSIINHHNVKKKMELNALILNLKSLITVIDEIVLKYK